MERNPTIEEALRITRRTIRQGRLLSTVGARKGAISAVFARGRFVSPAPAYWRCKRWNTRAAAPGGRTIRGRSAPSLYTLGPLEKLP